MADKSGSGLDVRLGTTPLRLVTDENGVPQYTEEDLPGPEVVDPKDGERFVDTFTSWHKGGFIREHVSDGFYYMAENVCCLVPGQIKPAPKRLRTADASLGGAGIDHYGIAGMFYDYRANNIFVVNREEAAAGNNVPNRLRFAQVLESGTVNNLFILTSTARELNGLADAGVRSRLYLAFYYTSGNVGRTLVPFGAEGYAIVEGTTFIANVAVPTLGLIEAGGRLFRFFIQSEASVGSTRGQLSNAALNADLAAAGSWTTALGVARHMEVDDVPTWSLSAFGDTPIVGTPYGLFALGPGGVPFNLTPQFESLPATWNFVLLKAISGGLILTVLSNGDLLRFNRNTSARLGVRVENPLAHLPVIHRIQDVFEDPGGNLWLYVRYPSAHPDLGTAEWQVWVGVKQGEGAYAWHQLWTDMNANEDQPPSLIMQPMLPVEWESGAQEIALGTGAGDDINRISFLDGRLFFGRKVDYLHEDATIGYPVTVRWRSGRFSRHDTRTRRHWTGLRFFGRNLGAAGASGGRIQVEVSFDGGAFGNPPAGATFLTTNDQAVALDTVARDVEVRLTWQLDGVAATMRDTPATVTQIVYEGREVPNATVRRITMLVRGASPPQPGGVRQKTVAKSLRDTLTTLITSVKQTFTDPYKVDRTVVVLPAHQLTASEAKGVGVPEGSIRIAMLETP